FSCDAEPDADDDAAGAVPAGVYWDVERSAYDHQRLVDGVYNPGDFGRHEHARAESAVGGERCYFELRQCNGEHFDDPVADIDLIGDLSGDDQLRCDHWGRLLDYWRGEFSCAAETDA